MKLRKTAVLVAGSALLMTGCGGGEEGGAEGGADATPSASATPTPTTAVDLPEGVATTEPGSQLAFGDTATVAHPLRGKDAVLDLTVDSAVQGSLKDFAGFALDDRYKRRGNYYYVRVTVANAGETRTGGFAVPLWGISGDNTLLQAVEFTSSFKKCPTEKLPARFRPGDEFQTCLVYLSPEKGELEGLSYRPTDEYVPIEWRGDVEAPAERAKKRGGAAQG
jgi:hypothetical protein